jgi:dipeptidyl-peptidase-4
MELTLERIFAAPPLGGVLPTGLKLSPDGSLVTFLRTADDDRERLDLWCFDTRDGQQRVLVDARSLGGNATLSDEEKARRERKRVFQHGIVEYEWLPAGEGIGESLVFPMAGVVYRHVLATAALSALTPAGAQQTDVRLAPGGQHAAYVRDGDLYVYDLAAGRETRLTFDGSASVSNGLAEFIAQEEMHRFEGYWWAPDGRSIAFTRVDSTPVPETHRHEIDADGITMVPQRYPFAGAANVQVRLLCIAIDAPGSARELPWATAHSEYLARVQWTRAGDALLVQRQSRLQDQLELVRIDVSDAAARVLTTERSPTWVNLHDNLHELPDGQLLWTSERDGRAKLYRIDPRADPASITCIADLGGMVTRVHGVDADAREVFVSGWQDDPTCSHLYAIGLADGATRRLTATDAWHQVVLAADGTRALDVFSTPSTLARVDVIDTRTGSARTLVANEIAEGHALFPYRAALAEVRFGTLAAADGQVLHYRLVLPRDFDPARRYPVLQHVYGGPGVSRVRREWLPWWYHFLASRDVLVFELDNRGSALRGRAFEAPIHRRLGEHEVQDQLYGLDWLQAQPFVDGARVAVAGHSYGGYMALMLLAKAPGRFAAGIASAPVSDWLLYDTHYTERYLGLPQENPDGYRDSAVLPWLANLRDPLLLVHGMADDNVLFTHATRLMKALQDQLTAFELMTYPGSKHGLAERSVALHRHQLMHDFLQRHIGAKR